MEKMGAEKAEDLLLEVQDDINFWGDHLMINLMDSLGWVSGNGMGVAPVSWTELDAFAGRTREPIDHDTLALCRHLSEMWCYGHHRGTDPAALFPSAWEEFDDIYLMVEEEFAEIERGNR